MAAVTRVAPAIAAAVAAAGCGNVSGFGGSVPPLATVRVQVTGGVQTSPGRGTLGLRLGLGGTLVHETRDRNQGMRAGLTGSELETSAFALLPAADLDAVVALHIAGPWLLMTSGGPSLDVHDGKLHAGWSAELGVAWQP